jgi:hypothetical protein
MAAYANQFIKDDIEVFWCTDMDEFFNKELIVEVEEILINKPNINCIGTDHYLFWNDFNTILSESLEKYLYHWELSRIARHKKGNKYSHCDLQIRYQPEFRAKNKIYHFSNVGKGKTFNKIFGYYNSTSENYKSIWEKYSNIKLEKNKLYGYPNMHPNSTLKMGIMLYPWDLKEKLNYINFEDLKNDINSIT